MSSTQSNIAQNTKSWENVIQLSGCQLTDVNDKIIKIVRVIIKKLPQGRVKTLKRNGDLNNLSKEIRSIKISQIELL
jgi:hypothetical protein